MVLFCSSMALGEELEEAEAYMREPMQALTAEKPQMSKTASIEVLRGVFGMRVKKWDPDSSIFGISYSKLGEQYALLKTAIDEGADLKSFLTECSFYCLTCSIEQILYLKDLIQPELSVKDWVRCVLRVHLPIETNESEYAKAIALQRAELEACVMEGVNLAIVLEDFSVSRHLLLAHQDFFERHLYATDWVAVVLSGWDDGSEPPNTLKRKAMDRLIQEVDFKKAVEDTLDGEPKWFGLLSYEVVNERKEQFAQILGLDLFMHFVLERLRNEKVTPLLEWALAEGGDINAVVMSKTLLERAIESDKVLESDKVPLILMLLKKGAKCGVVENINIREWTENGLGHLLKDPKAVLHAKYQHLGAKPGKEARMPYIMHHIWLTHSDKPREIPVTHLDEVLKTKALFEKSGVEWTHIVWTNAEDLIPESIAALKAAGVKVQSIHDWGDKLRNYAKIVGLIESKTWGMASDILRYSLVHYFGGVYADLNFVFNRDVMHEVHTYDYFTMTFQNYYIDNFFFAARPHHPIMETLVAFFEKPQPSYLSDLPVGSSTLTDMGTANPTFISYYTAANRNGTRDVVYPITVDDDSDADNDFSQCDLEEKIVEDLIKQVCPQISQFEQFIDDIEAQEYSGGPELKIGHDGKEGGTWLDRA